MYKGIGPNGLGSPNKMCGKSPLKQTSDMPGPMSSNDIMGALRHKKEVTGTGGIKVDNTLVGVGTGTAIKAGVKAAAARTAGAWTGKKSGAIADLATTAYEMAGS
jgi:hypothetical protein